MQGVPSSGVGARPSHWTRRRPLTHVAAARAGKEAASGQGRRVQRSPWSGAWLCPSVSPLCLPDPGLGERTPGVWRPGRRKSLLPVTRPLQGRDVPPTRCDAAGRTAAAPVCPQAWPWPPRDGTQPPVSGSLRAVAAFGGAHGQLGVLCPLSWRFGEGPAAWLATGRDRGNPELLEAGSRPDLWPVPRELPLLSSSLEGAHFSACGSASSVCLSAAALLFCLVFNEHV